MQVSLMIEIMRFFCIKRECDTSSKAMLELRRLILRGSLEIHVGDYMMLMGLLLRISWGSDEFEKHPWERKVSEQVTRGPDIPDQYLEGEILRCDPLWMISSLWGEVLKGNVKLKYFKGKNLISWLQSISGYKVVVSDM